MADKKINDLAAVAGLLDTQQLETDVGGTTSGKVTGLQLKEVLQTVPPSDTLIFDPAGSDITGDGTPQNPYETAQAAHDSLSPGSLKLIKSEGSGFLNQSLTITRDNTFVFGPGVVLFPAAGDAVTVNVPGGAAIGFRFGGLIAPGANAINIVDAAGVGMDVPIISGAVTIDAGAHTLASHTLAADLTLAAPAQLNVNALFHGGTLNSFAESNVFGRLGMKWNGSFLFDGRTRITRDNVIELPAGVTLSDIYIGMVVLCTNAGPIIHTIPQESSVSMPVGRKMTITRGAAGTVSFVTEGTDSIIGSPGPIASTGDTVVLRKVTLVGGVSTWTLSAA